MKELEAAGYIDRHQTRENGRITGYETVVYERPRIDIEGVLEPVTENPEVEPETDSSFTEIPDVGKPIAGNPTQVIKILNNKDFKDDCMTDARDPDPILAALSRRLSVIPLNDTHSVGDFYFPDIYAALVRHFPDKLDAEVIELAAEQYVYAAIDLRTNLPKINVGNPVGLFVDAYKTALTQYKALRYKRKRAVQ
ncbi:hypothetical protein D3C87_1105690 [compost metagenome]